MKGKFQLTYLIRGIAIAVLGLTPVFFLPVTENFYDTNKWALLAAGALCVVAGWAVALFRLTRPVHLNIPAGALGFGALSIASVIGLIAGSGNKIEALISPLGPVTFIALTILILAAGSRSKQENTYLSWVLYTITGLIGLIAFYQWFGMGKLIFGQGIFLADPLWTPTGSVTSTIAICLITLSLLGPAIAKEAKKHHEHGTLALLIIAFLGIVTGAAVTIIQFIPKIHNLLPFDTGMVIASIVLKNPVAAMVGVGVENFVSAFTMVRPAGLTATFATNADFFLHVLTVYGVIGLVAAVLLVVSLFRTNNTGWPGVTKWVCVAALLVIPPTIALLAVLAIVIILTNARDSDLPKPISVAPWIRIFLGIFLLLTAGGSFYFLIRAYTAELYFFRSIRAAQANDGTKTYNLQIRAIQTNTYISRYHATYSRTSLSLADTLAGSLGTGSDKNTDRQLIGDLIAQAVREAKTAVTLNPADVSAWENLGLTYQSIMPVASEAAGWALAAYEKSTALDPVNPVMYVNIGTVLVYQKQYEKAIAAFKRANELDPTYANALYNLANVYKLKGDTRSAVQALTETLRLVEPESSDYYKVKNELDGLQNNQPPAGTEPAAATGSSTLTLPQVP